MRWHHVKSHHYYDDEFYYFNYGRIYARIDTNENTVFPEWNKYYLSIYFDDTYSDKVRLDNRFDYGRMEFKSLDEAKKAAEDILMDFANNLIKTIKE